MRAIQECVEYVTTFLSPVATRVECDERDLFPSDHPGEELKGDGPFDNQDFVDCGEDGLNIPKFRTNRHLWYSYKTRRQGPPSLPAHAVYVVVTEVETTAIHVSHTPLKATMSIRNGLYCALTK